MPLILGAQSAATAAAVVTNSCRFNDGDSAYLSRTFGTPTDNNVWTFSFWMKRGILDSAMQMFDSDTTGGNEGYLLINSAADPATYIYQASPAVNAQFNIYRKLRDPSAWMHVVWSFNSDESTEADRMQIWYNGVRGDDFSTDTQPALNAPSTINEAKAHQIGAKMDGSRYFDGYLAEVVFIDGSALAPTSFGEFNEDSPTIWQPIDVSGLTFGDNGFHLDFEDSSALGNDVSGNDNDWTANNLAAADQATDTPVNNFCVNNPLDNYFYGATFSEGNCKIAMDASSNETYGTTTIGLSAGKWYWEVKWTSDTGGNNLYMGITNAVSQSEDDYYLGRATGEYAYAAPYGYWVTAASGTTYGDTYAPGDIIGVYLDLDNNKLYFGKNGTVQASGTGIDITAAASTTHGFYWPAVSYAESGSTCLVECNYGGCPSFTVSSGNTDTNGYGNFEYDPSSGTFDSASKDFLAICTKNLGSDGG